MAVPYNLFSEDCVKCLFIEDYNVEEGSDIISSKSSVESFSSRGFFREHLRRGSPTRASSGDTFFETIFSWAAYNSIFVEGSSRNIFGGIVYGSIINGGVYESFLSGTLPRKYS